jgi:hypothetical protein
MLRRIELKNGVLVEANKLIKSISPTAKISKPSALRTPRESCAAARCDFDEAACLGGRFVCDFVFAMHIPPFRGSVYHNRKGLANSIRTWDGVNMILEKSEGGGTKTTQ